MIKVKNTFNHQRKIDATPDKVFVAIADSKRLEKWWGPSGKDYSNGSQFLEIVINKKVIIKNSCYEIRNK